MHSFQVVRSLRSMLPQVPSCDRALHLLPYDALHARQSNISLRRLHREWSKGESGSFVPSSRPNSCDPAQSQRLPCGGHESTVRRISALKISLITLLTAAGSRPTPPSSPSSSQPSPPSRTLSLPLLSHSNLPSSGPPLLVLHDRNASSLQLPVLPPHLHKPSRRHRDAEDDDDEMGGDEVQRAGLAKAAEHFFDLCGVVEQGGSKRNRASEGLMKILSSADVPQFGDGGRGEAVKAHAATVGSVVEQSGARGCRGGLCGSNGGGRRRDRWEADRAAPLILRMHASLQSLFGCRSSFLWATAHSGDNQNGERILREKTVSSASMWVPQQQWLTIQYFSTMLWCGRPSVGGRIRSSGEGRSLTSSPSAARPPCHPCPAQPASDPCTSLCTPISSLP